MLKNNKSSYFIKILFSYVDEKQKLEVVKYNKILQKNLDISIINYKFFRGIYIIYESNRIGKEYDGISGELLFEGEYLNKKRNGKGKEYYDDGKLIFEGEYLNGKKWNGKEKKYDFYGSLLSEDEYINGEKQSQYYNFCHLMYDSLE